MSRVIGLMLAAGVLVGHNVAFAKDTVLREKCEGNRCVYYERGGNRVGTVTRDDTGRYEIRDRSGKLTHKAERQRDGSVRLKKFGPRR